MERRARGRGRWCFCIGCPAAVPMASWDCHSPKFCWYFAIRCKSIRVRKELGIFGTSSLVLKCDYWFIGSLNCCWWCLLYKSSQLVFAMAPRLCKWFLEGKLISLFAYSKKKKSCLFVALRHAVLFIFSIGLLWICTSRDCTMSLYHSYILQCS